MTSSSKIAGHLSCFVAYAIFGFNIIVCKNLANSHTFSPLGLFCIRSLGAMLLFWLISFFMPREKVEKRDLLKIFLASMLGLFITQMCFLEAVRFTTPLDLSIITSITPIFTMFVAAVALKEPLTWKKAGGVALSFFGVILLITNSVNLGGGASETKPIGIILMILNCLCFACYLGIFKPLIAKYSVVTFMKWMFLFSVVVSVPFDFQKLISIDYVALPTNILLELGFLVLFSTFTAYFLIPIGQKVLRPTVISLYAYLQPLIASLMSIYMGMDVLTWTKAIAAVLVLSGAVLVNKSRAAADTLK